MKNMFLIYNPVSGKGNFKNRLDYVLKYFQEHGFMVTPHRLAPKEQASDVLNDIDTQSYDLIVSAGGDGTLNSVVKGMIQSDIDLPLGIIPAGTSNDFANHLGIKRNLEKCLETICKGDHKPVDIGTINDEITFINVVSVGNLTSIAHKTNAAFKNNLGKLAYYINVLGQYPAFKPFKLKLTIDEKEYVEDALLFFVLNSPCAGGFKSLAPQAKVDDGKFDVLVIKNCKLVEKLSLFIKVLKGEHHTDDCVLYFQADKLVVSCDGEVETDVDGEEGPSLPMEIKCLNKIKIIS